MLNLIIGIVLIIIGLFMKVSIGSIGDIEIANLDLEYTRLAILISGSIFTSNGIMEHNIIATIEEIKAKINNKVVYETNTESHETEVTETNYKATTTGETTATGWICNCCGKEWPAYMSYCSNCHAIRVFNK